MESNHCYFGCGIAFQSELPLPGIPRIRGERPTATVRFGTIPKAVQVPLTKASWFHATPQRLEFLIPGIGRYLVTEGREVLIEAVDGASESDLRVFLMGSAFGALLYQRGVLPLHASSVRVSGSCVAFLGESGDGKSTQAAVLHRAGYPVAGDDICPVSISGETNVVADCGFPRLKLWSDALDSLGVDRNGLERSCVDRDKYDVVTYDPDRLKRMPLAAAYLLEYAADRHDVGIERIRGQSCLPQMLRHTYRYCFVDGLDCTQRHFHTCMQLAKFVPIFRLRRLRGANSYADTVQLLEQHWERTGISECGNAEPSAA